MRKNMSTGWTKKQWDEFIHEFKGKFNDIPIKELDAVYDTICVLLNTLYKPDSSSKHVIIPDEEKLKQYGLNIEDIGEDIEPLAGLAKDKDGKICVLISSKSERLAMWLELELRRCGWDYPVLTINDDIFESRT
jgi:hypothetical protein